MVVSMTVRVRGSGVKTSPVLPFHVLFVGGEANAPSTEAAVEGVKLAEFSDMGVQFGDVVRMVRKGGVVVVYFRVTHNGRGVEEEREKEDRSSGLKISDHFFHQSYYLLNRDHELQTKVTNYCYLLFLLGICHVGPNMLKYSREGIVW